MLAVVTGASSGLGEALCWELHLAGYEVVGIARHFSKETPFTTLSLDLCDEKQRSELCSLLEKRPPDLLINNAGVGCYGLSTTLSWEQQRQLLLLNASVPFELTLTLARALQREGREGVILNVSSALAYLPCPGAAAYSASKAYLTHLSLALDVELQPFGIRVLSSNPGQIATSFRFKAAGSFEENPPVSRWSLSPKKAAQLILKQITSRKQTEVIDGAYRWLLRVLRFLPRRWVMKFLQKEITSRLP